MPNFQTSLARRIQVGNNQLSYQTQATSAAEKLYQKARSQSWSDKIRSSLGGRSHRLLDLGTVQATCKGLGHRNLGRKYISISRIQGSANEGRRRDFDADFRPLKTHNEARWLNVAMARQQDIKLPPVALIQVGDLYFVQDGHHRISVAQTLGEKEIEAVVTMWQVAGQLPWEKDKDQVEPSLRTNIIPKQASL